MFTGTVGIFSISVLLELTQNKKDSTETKKNINVFEIAALFSSSYRPVKSTAISKLDNSLVPSIRSYIVLALSVNEFNREPHIHNKDKSATKNFLILAHTMKGQNIGSSTKKSLQENI